MTKDSIGNRLEHGHFVEVAWPNGLTLKGRIKTIEEGRVVRISGTKHGDQGKPQNGTVVVEIIVPVDVDARTGIALALTRLWDPTGKDLELAQAASQEKV